MSLPEKLITTEHGTIEVPEELAESFSKVFADALGKKGKESRQYLGIDGNFKASYYIGASWFQLPGESSCCIPLQVLPKEPDGKKIDFIKMFAIALDVTSAEEAEYFSDYYHINLDASPINLPNDQENLITPLLLLHYISLLTQLVKGGLRKGYVQREENLQSKVRGRILFHSHLRQNVFAKREDRMFCSYQEYTVDTPENRLLKKALLFAKNNLLNVKSLESKDNKDVADDIFQKISHLESEFETVSDEVSLTVVKGVSESKLYRHYAEAIKIAKMILQYFDNDIDEGSGENSRFVRPFYIDMSRLYEMYVFHKLNEAYPGQIKFQVSGRHKTQVDYIKVGDDEKIILDAKYKPRYKDGNKGIVDDVREISGYARDKKILKELGWNAKIDDAKGKLLPDCVIIYPVVQVEENDDLETLDFVAEENCRSIDELNSFDSSKTIIEQCDEIKAFEGFYKIAIPLPIKK